MESRADLTPLTDPDPKSLSLATSEQDQAGTGSDHGDTGHSSPRPEQIVENVHNVPPVPTPRTRRKLKDSQSSASNKELELRDLKQEILEKNSEIVVLKEKSLLLNQENLNIKHIVQIELEEIKEIKNAISSLTIVPHNKVRSHLLRSKIKCKFDSCWSDCMVLVSRRISPESYLSGTN